MPINDICLLLYYMPINYMPINYMINIDSLVHL